MPLLMLSKTGLLCIMSGCKRDDSTMISKCLNIAVLIFIALARNIFIRFHQLHGLWSDFMDSEVFSSPLGRMLRLLFTLHFVWGGCSLFLTLFRQGPTLPLITIYIRASVRHIFQQYILTFFSLGQIPTIQ